MYQAYENKAKHHWCKSPNFNYYPIKGGLLPVVPIQLPVYLWAVWKNKRTSHVSSHTWMKQHVKKSNVYDKSAKQKQKKKLNDLITLFNEGQLLKKYSVPDMANRRRSLKFWKPYNSCYTSKQFMLVTIYSETYFWHTVNNSISWNCRTQMHSTSVQES